jgi:hypothetical protein
MNQYGGLQNKEGPYNDSKFSHSQSLLVMELIINRFKNDHSDSVMSGIHYKKNGKEEQA